MRQPKIAFIGAGSTVFAQNLLGDILSYPELRGADIRLLDIDPVRLATTDTVARRVARELGATPGISVTTDRERALDGADYVINMIQVGGYKPATVTDFEVPKKYGLRQTIADTLGIGGIMRALRTVPVLLDMSRDMERLCPDTLHLNYVNPMAMNIWALYRQSPIKTVGLCHSVQHTAGELASDLGIPVAEIDYLCAGINHMAFYLKFEHQGEDLYPKLLQIAEEGRAPKWNRVRYEMLRRLGYFVTESSEHFSEYVPYFIKERRPELIEQFGIPLDEYPRRCESQIASWETLRARLEDDTEKVEVKRSVEYGSLIIHSMETGLPRVVYGNVRNDALIDNLPEGCCVEVPCLVDRNGLQPTRVGGLPPQLAALMQTNINVQALTVEALVTGKREHVYHAAMLDPHTSSELTLDQIWALVDDLLEAHGEWIPEQFHRRKPVGV
ncbi:alpha-glucosidase/alpha-galactosidase [Deinococcus peraridilitoris]|uniref:Family 4 glycosyl hydrolase, alpha-galactosidase/6-phospho-beta-glucosidase n=1 Tax=Deinococcus peraridilitoris (strain DSM 19664 / LMG 22246 / CIP 109416 / KR-200) TaxID=937777 RepID=K9ZZ15_DEIPD|nr:alpha-glucosidase/alpha-galactosidase [Deinococcus peraridilitoris]AFZ66893.1 family 4 glycosyl hydrolase, alpha-galactosidase/6-phospho-beta-glucosidase [Deinococcus peraridilitoris DSM 19664]